MKSVEEIARIIEIPVLRWAGQCYGIASELLRYGLVEDASAVLRYGHWLGPVSPHCPVEGFRNGLAFQRHGWIEIPGEADDPLDYEAACVCGHIKDEHDQGFCSPCQFCEDCDDFERMDTEVTQTLIIDPTRWVFEGVAPYIYVGPNDHYDMGGNELRAALEQPCPSYLSSDARSDLAVWKFDPAAHTFVMQELFDGAPGVTRDMARWLANLALPRLERHANAIYRALVDAGDRGAIPIDNYRAVLGRDPEEEA